MDNAGESSTIKTLFQNRQNIKIPLYQRAFSWEREQCEQFLLDLIEQHGKSYHLGLFIFEQENGISYIIDGQQRLTTVVLFLAAIVKIKKEHSENNTDIVNKYLMGSFSTIEDDNEYFYELINCILQNSRSKTISQGKLKYAFDYFVKKLQKQYDKGNIDLLQKSLEDAKIGIFDIHDKGEASQIFEYQNNRGIPASDFEIVKAYLIHQVFIKTTDYTRIIQGIQANISEIYRNLEAINEYFSEDDILWTWFCLYEYQQIDYADYNIDGIKRCLSPENKDKPIENTVQWVQDFFNAFEKITKAAVVLVVHKKDTVISNLFIISKTPRWYVVMLAVLIKSNMKFTDEIFKMAKLFEILWFKYEVSNRRKDKMPEWAYNYFNEESDAKISFEELIDELKKSINSGFDGNWAEFKDAIPVYLRSEDHFNQNKTATRYVLWQYENNMRRENGFPELGIKDYKKYNSIEHIKPQDREFSYINKIGNLTLLTQPDNSRASDFDFDKKKHNVYYKYYDEHKKENTKLLQFSEIVSNNDWRETEVKDRFEKIKKFAFDYFK